MTDRSGFFDALLVFAGGVAGVLIVRAISGKKRPTGPVTPSQALLALRASIDAAYPERSRAADGILPSAQHHAANPKSDHEWGNALDVTYDPSSGPDLDALADMLIVDPRVTYVIWNRRIANRAIEDGAWRSYAATAVQSDPHTSHLHVSVDKDRRGDASSWSVPMPLPAGYVHMADRNVTPEMAAWAKELLSDRSFAMGQVRARAFGDRRTAARAEIHPPSPTIDHRHRGVSLYEASSRVA